LNPVLLVYGVGGAHNDLLVVLVVMAGVLLAVVERERMGGLAVLAGAGLKASAGVVLPFLVAGSARPRRAIEGALLGVAPLAALAPDRRLRVATVAFSVFVVGARLPMFAG